MEEEKELIEQIGFIQKETGESSSVIARKIGISNTAFTQWRHGNYGANTKIVNEKVSAFIRKQVKQKTGPKELQFTQTKNAEIVYDVCRFALNYAAVCAIIGRAGIGKTFALKRFQSENQNVHYIYCSGSLSYGALLYEFGKAAQVSTKNRADVLFRNIVRKISHSTRIFIVDEAHKLNFKCLELLREIHDQTNVGIVMAGDTFLYDRISGRSHMGSDKNFDQLYSRVQRLNELDAFSFEDTKKVLGTVFNTLDERMAKMIYEKTGGVGRSINNMIRLLQIKGTLKSVNKEAIEETSNYIILAA